MRGWNELQGLINEGHFPQVKEATEFGDGDYAIDLEPGYWHPENESHWFYKDTPDEIFKALHDEVERCDCKDCKLSTGREVSPGDKRLHVEMSFRELMRERQILENEEPEAQRPLEREQAEEAERRRQYAEADNAKSGYACICTTVLAVVGLVFVLKCIVPDVV